MIARSVGVGLAVASAVALMAAGSGCTREPAPRPEVGNRGGATGDAGPAVDGGDPPCVLACVRDRQMVAMSPEAIRAACQVECAAAR